MKTLRFSLLVLTLSIAVSTSAQLVFYAVPPCRVADTRNSNGPLGGPSLAAMQQRDFPILQSACGIPTTAAAYSLNLTVVPHGTLGYLSIWPTGLNQPLVSTLNSFQGFIIANAAIVPAGSSGQVSVFVTDDTDLVIDVDGYFAMPTASQNINHARTTVTVASINAFIFTVDWASPFSDTNYTVTCFPEVSPPILAVIRFFQISAVTPSSISITMGVEYQGGYPFPITIHCIGLHD